VLKGFVWLGKTIAAGLIISFLSIWTTGYIVNSYVESLLKQYNIPIEMKPAAVSGVWGKLWGAGGGQTAGKSDQKDGAANQGTAGQETANQETEGQVTAGQETAEQESQQGLPPLTGIGGGGGAETNSEGVQPDSGVIEGGTGEADGLDGQELAVTTDDITGLKEEMSSEDKDQLFTLLMSKLPQESWQTISVLMEEGLTDDELITLQQIMAQHLDKEEYESMMTILKKY